MKKQVISVCALLQCIILLGTDELAQIPIRSAEETEKLAYDRAVEIREYHQKGIFHEHNNARVMEVSFHNGAEQWVDLGLVIAASPALMAKIESHSVIAPLCGKDAMGKPVLAILIQKD